MSKIYVDEAIFPYRNQMWCHMYSLNVWALHDFAKSIGLKRSWFRAREEFPHYDLSPSKRAKAVKAGAIEVTCREMVKLSKDDEGWVNEAAN